MIVKAGLEKMICSIGRNIQKRKNMVERFIFLQLIVLEFVEICIGDVELHTALNVSVMLEYNSMAYDSMQALYKFHGIVSIYIFVVEYAIFCSGLFIFVNS